MNLNCVRKSLIVIFKNVYNLFISKTLYYQCKKIYYKNANLVFLLINIM